MTWQPISTAPRDGTEILVYCGPDFDPMWGIAYWDEGLPEEYAALATQTEEEKIRAMTPGWAMWWDNDARRPHKWPTHWMPLPDPPSTTTESERLAALENK